MLAEQELESKKLRLRARRLQIRYPSESVKEHLELDCGCREMGSSIDRSSESTNLRQEGNRVSDLWTPDSSGIHLKRMRYSAVAERGTRGD